MGGPNKVTYRINGTYSGGDLDLNQLTMQFLSALGSTNLAGVHVPTRFSGL